MQKPESELEPGIVFRDILTDGSQGPEMVVIPSGTFRMGDIIGSGHESEQPVHPVRIIRRFAIGRYQVTFEEYDQFVAEALRESPSDEGWGRGRRPVINVSWIAAVSYARWLSSQTSKVYRLPSEAEWEYAARAGTETTYWWGNEMRAGMANCCNGSSKWSGKQTAPVGSFEPNPFGLYDMVGNVSEWVQDCWHDNYHGAPPWNLAWGLADGTSERRVIRGGSWLNSPEFLRSSIRTREKVGHRNYLIGFRVARDLD
jgi:formylglycine-generating enzyme required for sulfatase activity